MRLEIHRFLLSHFDPPFLNFRVGILRGVYFHCQCLGFLALLFELDRFLLAHLRRVRVVLERDETKPFLGRLEDPFDVHLERFFQVRFQIERVRRERRN